MTPELPTQLRRALPLILVALLALATTAVTPLRAKADFYSDGLILSYPSLSVNMQIQEGSVVNGVVQVPNQPGIAWHFPNTAWPGQGNKSFFFAHDQPGYFDWLNYAHVGDVFTIRRPDNRTFAYTVYSVNNQTAYNDPTLTAPGGVDEVVLFTCQDWNDTGPKLAVKAWGQQVPPDAPASVSTRRTDNSVVVSWTPPTIVGWSPVTGYLVSAVDGSGGGVRAVPASANSFDFTGLSDTKNYLFRVQAVNLAGPGNASSDNQLSWVWGPAANATQRHQSYVQSSVQATDSASWFEVDPALRRSFTLNAGQVAVVGADMALWTAAAGYNQDLGIFKVNLGSPPCDLGAGNSNLVAWKESGGFGGTFSPNAAFVQAVIPDPGPYTLTLCWKANKPSGPNTIYGAAGTANTSFSSTILTVKTEPAANVTTAVTYASYVLNTAQPDAASNWYEIDPALRLTYLAPADGAVILDGNMDLWTAQAGFNQDIGIFAGAGCSGQPLAWKESGGFAGIYSPNAALVEGLAAVANGSTTTYSLCWKANKAAPAGTVYGAAGTVTTYFSPTRLTAEFVPTGSYQGTSAARSFQLGNYQPDAASNWYPLNPVQSVTVSSPTDRNAEIGANMDLWTALPGFNQDLGIFVSLDGGPEELAAWTESGGFAGILSPNAAYLQLPFQIRANHSYRFSLRWKANKTANPGTVYGGAGTSGTGFSTTTLIADLTG